MAGWLEGIAPDTALSVELKWSESEYSAWEVKSSRISAVHDAERAIDLSSKFDAPSDFADFGFSFYNLEKQIADFISGKGQERSIYPQK